MPQRYSRYYLQLLGMISLHSVLESLLVPDITNLTVSTGQHLYVLCYPNSLKSIVIINDILWRPITVRIWVCLFEILYNKLCISFYKIILFMCNKEVIRIPAIFLFNTFNFSMLVVFLCIKPNQIHDLVYSQSTFLMA